MFMPFNRQPQPTRQSHGSSMPDATGTPFIIRGNAGARPSTAEPRDYREQADGAP